MSNASDLHDELDNTFEDKMDDIEAAIESASRVADSAKALVSRFKEHEVRVYNMRRTFLVSLNTKTAWRDSIKRIRNLLKKGLVQLGDQLSKSERDCDFGGPPTRTRHEVVPLN